MPSAARVERLHRDLLDFLLEAHEQVITEQDGAAFARRIADIRTLTERLRARYASADEKKLLRKLRAMSAAELKEVARAFTLLFWLLNLAEERHAAALRSAKESDAFRSLFERTRRAGLDAERVAERIGDLRATVVLTAHPTEALRWSLRETLDRIDDLLTRREGRKGAAREAVEEEILGEITGLWLSTTIRTRKPTPLDEVRYAIHILQEVLVHAVPEVTAKLLTAFRDVYGRSEATSSAALEHAAHRSIRVGSWMG